jgi:hypothetical protein
MKALTMHQPWASLIALGEKKIETRNWATYYRGRLAIHAAKIFHDDGWEFAAYEPCFSVLASHGLKRDELPLGCVLAIVDLESVVMTEYASVSIVHPLSAQERAFGNFGPKRFAWEMKVLRRFTEPIPARGYQGLWDFDERSAGL